MTKTKIFSISTIFGGLFLAFAFGAANDFSLLTVAEAQTQTTCDVKTYIADSDPNGTNVRAAPDKNSKVLRRIKNDDVIVRVAGFSDGWFEISSAETVGGDNIFKGRGWIHSSLLGIGIAESDPKLYAQPKKNSRVLLKLKPDETAVKLIACQDDWVKVQAGEKTGWLSPGGQCGNPVTTCP